MSEQQWEIELTQIRQLMKNEIASHGRIRDRVLRLQEFYYAGAIEPDAPNWERWACDRFAYNMGWLRFMSRAHPLTIDRVKRDLQRDRDRLADDQRKFDASRSQIAWDGYIKELKRAQRAGIMVDVGDENLTIKPTKIKKKPVIKQLPFEPPPPTADMQPHLINCAEIERRDRLDLGREYQAMREKVQTNKAGRNPHTNKPWSWMQYISVYIRRSREDVSRCIRLYEDNMLVVTSDHNIQQQHVLQIIRG